MPGSGDGGTFEGRSSTLKQTDGLFVEGRGDSPVDPEQLGVELLRQLGLEEDRGLPAQGRHFAEAPHAFGSEMLRECLRVEIRRDLTRALLRCERDVTVYSRPRSQVSMRAAGSEMKSEITSEITIYGKKYSQQ
jgi:hypothetical protein